MLCKLKLVYAHEAIVSCLLELRTLFGTAVSHLK